MTALTPQQQTIADRVLDEEERARAHLVVSLSGAHAYGFPSPDSDLDLKAIHVAPTAQLLGLSSPGPGPSRMEVIEGVEIDYSSNEIQGVLQGILNGNGNYLERVLGAIPLRVSPDLETLRPLVRRTLSRRAHRHYHGFAGSQRRELEAAIAPTAKKVLYVLRTTLTGAHLLATGEVVTDLGALCDGFGLSEAHDLIAQKRAGERVTLDGATLDHWRAALDRAFQILDEARDRSPLPEEPESRAELEAWLLQLRRARW
jgi:predicted nucleotidyltransferase